MFGSVAQKATKTKSHWPYDKNYQVTKNLSEIERKPPGNQDAGPYLKKIKVDSNKTQKPAPQVKPPESKGITEQNQR